MGPCCNMGGAMLYYGLGHVVIWVGPCCNMGGACSMVLVV